MTKHRSGIQPPGKDAAVRPQIYSMPTPGTSGARDADITKVTFPLSDASHALGEVTDTSAKSEGAFPSKSPPGSQIVDEVAGEASDLATSSRKEDVAYTVVPRRREEFHTLQEEVQKKRSDGMRCVTCNGIRHPCESFSESPQMRRRRCICRICCL